MASLRDQVLELVLGSPGGASLKEVAVALGRDSPPVLHHLQALVHEGLLRREEGTGRPRYHAQPYFAATLVLPESGQVARWAITDRVSWRFPLTSRIADKRARDAVILFLRAVDRSGLLARPDLSAKSSKRGRGRARTAENGGYSEKSHGWRFVVYGSVARGEAGPSSDVDLLALPGAALRPRDYVNEIRDLAAEVNLAGHRRVDVNVFDRANPPFPGLVEAVRREGFIVYSTYDGGEYEPLLEDEP